MTADLKQCMKLSSECVFWLVGGKGSKNFVFAWDDPQGPRAQTR